MSRALVGVSVGRVEEATGMLQEGLETFRRLDDQQYVSMSLATLGWMAFVKGDLPLAARLTADNLRATLRMRDLATTTISLHTGMLLGVMAGRYEEAALVAGAFDASCERFGVRPPADLERFIQGIYPYETIRASLGAEAYEAVYGRGAALGLTEAVQHVLALAEAIGAED